MLKRKETPPEPNTAELLVKYVEACEKNTKPEGYLELCPCGHTKYKQEQVPDPVEPSIKGFVAWLEQYERAKQFPDIKFKKQPLLRIGEL